MVLIPVLYLSSQSNQIIKRGKINTGQQRFHYQNAEYSPQSFVSAHRPLLSALEPRNVEVAISRVYETEVDVMLSFVGKKEE